MSGNKIQTLHRVMLLGCGGQLQMKLFFIDVLTEAIFHCSEVSNFDAFLVIMTNKTVAEAAYLCLVLPVAVFVH